MTNSQAVTSKALKITLAAVAFSALLACSDDNNTKSSDKDSAKSTNVETSEQESQAENSQTQSDGISDGMEQQVENTEVDTSTSAETKKGLYVYHEDSATFTDCSNNQSYPVAKEGNYYELEATYIALKDEAKQKLLFEVKGEYDMRAPEEGDDVDMLIPSELIGVVHKESCQ